MDYNKCKDYALFGAIAFAGIVIFGIIFSALALGRFNALFWLIIPSIIFESIFETCCYAFSNNKTANLAFSLLFWTVICIIIGWVAIKFRKLS